MFFLSTTKSFSGPSNIAITRLYMKRDLPDSKSLARYYKPRGENQSKYVKYLDDYKVKVIFGVGPAGTGKTMLACNTAIRELKSGIISKIVLTRPVVTVEEDIGFLPGNINKKMDPWTRPIFDVFLDFFSQKDIDMMVQNNIIEVSPLAYMRGRTFKNSFIIADEMQNSSPNQMLMLTTRIGEGSRMVITGDLNQSDKGLNSGLSDFINKYRSYESRVNDTGSLDEIQIVEFGVADVERSPVVAKILDIYAPRKVLTNFSGNQTAATNTSAGVNSTENVVVKNNKTSYFFNSEFFVSSPIYNDAAMIPIQHLSNSTRRRSV